MSDVWLQSQIFDCVVRVEQGGALNRQPHNHGADGSVETTFGGSEEHRGCSEELRSCSEELRSCSGVN